VTWLVLAVSALLTVVAGVGVLRPFGRGVEGRLDERASALHTLAELDEELATGQLSAEAHRALRSEAERRAVAVLRAIEASTGEPALAEARSELRRPHPDGNGGTRRPRVAPYLAAAVAVVGVAGLLLSGALRARSSGEPITGNFPGPSSSADPLAFFEQRVADHPEDVAARLDLAQRYLETGDPRSAIEQYEVALQLDPRNAEAHAKLGFLLFAGGRPNEALDAVDQALAFDPGYPEALYYKGLILYQGLDRPQEAAEVFRQYLTAAPYGAFRDEVERALQEIEAAGSG
jgi:tetratricopeptide (TPR) repeat protein